MPAFETLLIVALVAATAVGMAALWAALRRPRPRDAAVALESGDFTAALAAGRGSDERDERFAAALAARHLLELPTAAELLDGILDEDPDDGEAWLERGLVAAYGGDDDTAENAWARVETSRSDLLESLTLHRAWRALERGDRRRARRLFEEIEAPLETKLRTDLGAGDTAFAEWFLHAAALWRDAGATAKADWALAQARASAPASRLVARFAG